MRFAVCPPKPRMRSDDPDDPGIPRPQRSTEYVFKSSPTPAFNARPQCIVQVVCDEPPRSDILPYFVPRASHCHRAHQVPHHAIGAHWHVGHCSSLSIQSSSSKLFVYLLSMLLTYGYRGTSGPIRIWKSDPERSDRKNLEWGIQLCSFRNVPVLQREVFIAKNPLAAWRSGGVFHCAVGHLLDLWAGQIERLRHRFCWSRLGALRLIILILQQFFESGTMSSHFVSVTSTYSSTGQKERLARDPSWACKLASAASPSPANVFCPHCQSMSKHVKTWAWEARKGYRPAACASRTRLANCWHDVPERLDRGFMDRALGRTDSAATCGATWQRRQWGAWGAVFAAMALF